ncbi:hypothetical protein RR46_10625 [Papilio xuthus]|uniref:C2H2-type domain-containing protein n=1 Tax=Papilio xuthus TaxID=66420 RepID=A0A194PQF5_PAPXU|nr:hypothetical protein RR46_10625 [Papilio xuthus]
MDDEIDIEEHDVLDNPVIKSIFPDLTILKQEVLGDYDEMCVVEQKATKDDIVPKLEHFSDSAPMSLEENIDEDHYVYNSHAPFIGNKIILGSKPISEKIDMEQKQVIEDSKSVGKVISENEVMRKQDIDERRNDESVVSESNGLCSKESETLLYRCKTCSYWFKSIPILKRHMVKKHKNNEPASSKKMLFDPKCKFCSLEYSNVFRYNQHIRKVHSKMLFCKIPKNKKPSSLPKCDKNSDKAVSVKTNSLNKINKKATIAIIDTKENHVKCILKSALFRCNRCDIHFLNAQVAMDHDSHMELLVNWKCLICRRIFKKNDKSDHMVQHSVTNYFTVYGISESTPSLILYNCPKCSVHFDEKKYLQHFPVCETVSFVHVKCKFCGILIDSNLECLHKSHHRKGNNLSTGFIIVKTDIIQKNTSIHDTFGDSLETEKTNEIRNEDVEHLISENNEMLQKEDIQDTNIYNVDLIVNNKELRISNLSNDMSTEDNKLFKVYYC